MSASLPAAPSLEQLRKRAKDLARAYRAGDPAAVGRVRAPACVMGASDASNAATAPGVPS